MRLAADESKKDHSIAPHAKFRFGFNINFEIITHTVSIPETAAMFFPNNLDDLGVNAAKCAK